MTLFTDLVCKIQKFKYLPTYWVSSIRNRGIMKCTIKIAMKFTRLIVYLLLKNYKIELTLTAVIYFLSVIFWVQNVLIAPFLILPTTATFYQLLLFTINFYNTFVNFYQLLPHYANFYYLY